jgi:hypothetical protein
MITSKIFGAMLALSTVGPVTYQAINHQPPVGVTAIENTAAANPGGEVVLRFDIEGRADCPTEIERSFIDASGIVTLFQKASVGRIGSGDGRPQSFRLRVPVDASAGVGVYRVTLAFRCNLVQRAFPVFRSFDVPVKIERGTT